jgi:protein involved in polysaccharide export with SLBB domain/capsular polysaccharide biosynthesis protein
MAARSHWRWLLAAAIVGAILGVAVGTRIWGTTYTATAQLVRYDTPDPQLFQPRPINPATLVGMVNSAEVRTRVGARFNPPRTADEIGAVARVAPVPNTDLVNIAVTADTAEAAANSANLYAQEAVKFTQEMQARDARDAASFLRHQLGELEKDNAALDAKFKAISASGTAPAAVAPHGASTLPGRLETARNDLADLQTRYTDAHPLVRLQLARIAALEKQIAAAAPAADATPAAAPAPATPTGEIDFLREKARSFEVQRRELTNRLQITELLIANPVGHYRLFSAAATDRVGVNDPRVKIALLAAFLAICGLVLGMIGAVTDEALDTRLRTPDDVRRVTGLPILARLAPLDHLDPEKRASWAFRTWTTLQSRLSASPNQGLVCGVISSNAGEGRSVWLKLLADAAKRCGFSVVLITTRPPGEGDEGRPASAAATSQVRFRTGRGEPKSADAVLVQETTLSDSLLGSPEEVADQIFAADNEGPSVVHIPLPGWVWNLEHRKEWLASLNTWGANENAVVLVELPPASTPEGILLAQNLPNVLWLSDTTKATALETRQQLETLRLARCNLVGAVMNRSNGTHLNERFARWAPVPAMAALAFGLMLASAPQAHAQAPAAEPAADGSFSIVSPAQRAAWQEHLTLGPGDVLRIGLYGEPVTARAEVTVQPDGRINFLEAHDVVANGLTIDQLRQELDGKLGEFRREPRTMITPVAFRSKKYHMLGLVSQKGSFTLDRPMTVVEAVARARGFETSATSGDVVELADLQHAFLIRNGQRKAVDFDRLFSAGDLSQNIPVEPGDYFYFPPADLREVYVLGQVMHPGPATLSDRSTSLRAIATRGGFTKKAWRDRVLVVRGSMSNPQPMTVNLNDVLEGRAPDIALEPHDIIYVAARPWSKAEELLDEAASSFAQSFVIYWASDNVVPVVPLQ